MRVAFLVEELGRSGGMGVVTRYAEHLGADLLLPETAPQDEYDVVIATWWTTAERLWDVPARRRVAFLQNLEHRFYREREVADRLGALGVLDLPVDYVVIASHMTELLADLRPDARVRHVANGIDKRVFTPAPARAADGPLRVLVEGQPTLWFKQVPEAVAAVRRMAEPATVTVATHDAAAAAALDADRVVSGLDPRGMAALYAEHDALLKLPRFEGLGLPPVEAFHVGIPAVLTPFTGSEEYARPGENCLVVPHGDPDAAAAALDRLAREPGLRERLRAGALATAAGWPSTEDACAAFAAALGDLLERPPPAPDAAIRAMAHGRRLFVEETRALERLVGEDWRRAYLEADARIAEYDALAQSLRTQIAELQRRPAFRVEARLRRLRRRAWSR